ncbi:hypothetical protein [Glycomyces sambucus]|nr:hypothetical protein [Glycomyces sambucus]
MRARTPLTFTAVLLVAATAGCGVSEIDTAQPGYVQAGEAFWGEWRVPEGAVLLGTPFPEEFAPQQEGLPEDPESVTAEFLLVDDPYLAVRDLVAQIEAEGLRVVAEPDSRACGVDHGFSCRLYGVGDDGLTKVAARFIGAAQPESGDPFPLLELEIGAWTSLYPSRDDWVDFEAPQGESGFDLPQTAADELGPGTEVPLFGSTTVLGQVPEGARLLAPLYNPSATYGVHAVFHIEEDTALAEIEAIADRVSSGERYPDADLTSGDLTSHRIAYNGDAGGCQVELDTVETGDAAIALLHVACD